MARNCPCKDGTFVISRDDKLDCLLFTGSFCSRGFAINCTCPQVKFVISPKALLDGMLFCVAAPVTCNKTGLYVIINSIIQFKTMVLIDEYQ